MLQSAGYSSVTPTQDPDGIFELHRENRYDLILPEVILMDINLPGISGFEALKLLHEDETTKHIPVVALSANAILRDIARGIEAGFFRYLTKPLRIGDFMDTLDVALAFAEQSHG